MNANQILTDTWSNPESSERYKQHWPARTRAIYTIREREPMWRCSFFAEFNADWGLCCHPKSRHHLETVFEHFTCPAFVKEGWGPHSFSEDEEFHCRCGGSHHENENQF